MGDHSKPPWKIWYDPKQNKLFVRRSHHFGYQCFSPDTMYLSWRKAEDPKSWGCVYIGQFKGELYA